MCNLWRQGEINLIANYEPRSPAAYFTAEHGASACGMAFRVKDAAAAYDEAIARGAEPVESKTGVMELRIPAIKGIGGAFIYLVDRYATLDNPDALSIYDIDFVYLPGVDRHPHRRWFPENRPSDAQCLWRPDGALGGLV